MKQFVEISAMKTLLIRVIRLLKVYFYFIHQYGGCRQLLKIKNLLCFVKNGQGSEF